MSEFDDERLGDYLRQLPMPDVPDGLSEQTFQKAAVRLRKETHDSSELLLPLLGLFTFVIGFGTWALIEWFFQLGFAFVLFSWMTAGVAAAVLGHHGRTQKGIYEPLS